MPGLTLEDLAVAGYVTDEWSTWQQGRCGTYAVALINTHPHLRFGTLGQSLDAGGDWVPVHHFAHDDTYAYDSAGKHPLPYHGVDGQCDLAFLDEEADWYGIPEAEAGPEGVAAHLAAARDHATRHHILTRPAQRRGTLAVTTN